jgi:hypothetical protein
MLRTIAVHQGTFVCARKLLAPHLDGLNHAFGQNLVNPLVERDNPGIEITVVLEVEMVDLTS